MSGRRRPGRAGKAVAAAVAVLAVAGATAAALGFDPTSLGRPAEADSTEAAPETAEVTRQTLTETVTASGDLDYGEAIGLGCMMSGIVTGLPAVGAAIGRGEELYAVDDKPVILMYGSLPAYRSLIPGLEGADVEQFEENLAELGYDGFTVDDEYTYKTAAAVKEWQEDLGLDETGTVDLGRVAYAPAKIRVDAIEALLGGQIGPGATVLDHTGLDKVVTVEVDLDDQELVAIGDPVRITLPDGTEAAGTVTGSETAVAESQGSDPDAAGETVLEVTVAADDATVFDGLDQAAVDVGFAGDSVEDVLTVPVEALLGLAEGGYGVELVTGGATEVVAVETGLFADGRVEVSGEGVEEGASVVVPS